MSWLTRIVFFTLLGVIYVFYSNLKECTTFIEKRLHVSDAQYLDSMMHAYIIGCREIGGHPTLCREGAERFKLDVFRALEKNGVTDGE